MPIRPSKGNHGHRDQGSAGRGGQKASTGSAVSPEFAEGQEEAITGEGTERQQAQEDQ
ncbi:MAG: hypothetical protein M3P53_00105 [Actinomycetota bacterium]|jgi:hypothetical protein|nr:hypothetical protein [Actinomycetota bacterium]